MKKGKKILRVISQILLAFFVSFSLEVLFTFFRGNEVNVPEELIDSAAFCVIYCTITFWLQRYMKAEKADENTDETQ